MNERIKALAGQALDRAVPDTWTALTAYDLDKFTKEFADLIIKECIAKAEEESERYLSWSTEDCDNFAKVMHNYQELLKEHFGIK